MQPDLNAQLARLPLIDRLLEYRPGQRLLAEATVDPTADPFLWGHCFKGTPFLPAAIVLEMFVQAASLLAEGRCVTGLSAIEFVNGVRFFTKDQATIWIEAHREADRVLCQMRSDFRNTKGQMVEAERLCTQGTVDLGEGPTPVGEVAPLDPVTVPWNELNYSEDRRNYFGPQMRCLKRVALEPMGGWGEIVIPDFAEVWGRRTGDGWIMHPAVFDACLVACDVLTEELFDRRIQLPHTYEAVRLLAAPRTGQTCLVRFHKLGHTGETTHYRWAFYDAESRPISQAIGYRCHLIDRPSHEQRSITLAEPAPQLR